MDAGGWVLPWMPRDARGAPGARANVQGLRTMTLAVVTLRLVSEVFAVRPSIVSKGSLSGLDPKEISI